MNAASQKRLTKVHPLLAERIQALAQNLSSKGIIIEVVQGLRTFAEQDALYAQGRTRPGQRVTNARGGSSNHNYGLAVDVAPVKNGKIGWEDWDGFGAIGKESRKLGLEWGGDWAKFVDKPHVQLPSPQIATLKKLYDKGGLPEVWKVANSTKAKDPEDDNGDIFKPPVNAVGFVESAPEPKPEDTAKGVTTSDKPASDTEGTLPPAPAVDVKASRPSLKSTAAAIITFVLGPLSYFGIDIKQAGQAGAQFAANNIGLAIKVAVGFGFIVIAAYIWNRAMDRAQDRTNKLMDAAASKDLNNLRLVKSIASPAPREDPKEGS